ncbi:MAG: enolase C-terminal domain-like protein [Pseudomonadota bacterium]
MQIKKLNAYLIHWPFNLAVSHSLADNTATDNIVVALVDGQGRVGYGEGVPRSYVTGETVQGSLEALQRDLAPLVLGASLEPEEALGWLEKRGGPKLVDRCPAAACAVETALLDLAGRAMERPVSALLSADPPAPVTYSAVIPLLPPEVLSAILAQAKALDFKQVKVKVQRRGAAELVAQVREALGPQVSLRVDANGAWSAAEAVENIGAMAPSRVEAVEQPVAKGDLEGLAKVTAAVEPLVLADESLCTMADAHRLVENRATGGFNLRLSKCGGPARTTALLEMASWEGLACMLGCQVGELGLLSALGRHFASVHAGLIYLEGCLTRFFMDRDLIREDLTFGPGGQAAILPGPGLGVEVDAAALNGSRAFSLS